MLICLSLALIAGLLMSRAAKAVRLPAVTAYLLTGLLLGPFFLGRLGLSRFGFGFGSLAAVEGYGILTQVALGFIAFVIGNEFRLSALKHMGRRAVTVGIAQAVITTALVDIALVALHFARPDVISLASAITLGSIAAATAPAATLMVVKQYKADGPLTKLLLMVVAIDDAVGLVLFSASYGVANALEQGRIDPVSVVLEPLLEIALSLALGAAAGYLLNLLEVYFHSRSKRMSLSVAFVLLTVGLSMTKFEINGTRCGFSLLLVCMMTGTVFCNVCPTSDELMDRLDRWVSPINILFFVLSGAELDLRVFGSLAVVGIGLVNILARSAGKILGASVSSRLMHCEPSICKYLGITLLPQAGVALGMAITAASLSDGALARNVVLFAVLIALGLWRWERAMIRGFLWFGRGVLAVITVGLAVAVFTELTGVTVIPGMAPLEGGVQTVAGIGFVLAGAFPLVFLLTKLLRRPLAALGRLLGMNGTAAAGLVASLANSIPMFGMVKDMDERGKIVNIAFAVPAAFVFGDHLGFTAGYDAAMLGPVIAAKLTGGVLAVLAALLFTRKKPAQSM